MAKPVSAIGSETDLLQCPYDVSHLIMRQRFQVHLVRCRKSHPNAEVVICPFDITHRINKLELEWHVSICTGRQLFENYRHQDASIVAGNNSLQRNATFNVENFDAPVGGEFVEPSEIWDDPDVPSYNPNDYIEKADVLRMPVGLTPAQRNAFRVAERKRLQALGKYA